MRLPAVAAILSIMMTCLTGCFSSRPEDIEAFLMPHAVNVTAERYVLQPPDEIEIHCTKVPEIHLQRQQIRPDGKVSFEGLGEIVAAGKTPEEAGNLVREKVLELYALEGDHPIDVRVAVFKSKLYYVLGQVYLPGPRVCTGRDRALTAIAEAQPNPMAWRERVQVVRPSSDPNVPPRIFEFDLKRMMVHGDTTKDVLLQEGDIIYVPPTFLASIALKIEEFARPIGRVFSTVYIVNRGALGGGYGGYGY